jgi:hypothetical protein
MSSSISYRALQKYALFQGLEIKSKNPANIVRKKYKIFDSCYLRNLDSIIIYFEEDDFGNADFKSPLFASSK